jgi:Zn-dependent M28 family amino/carboxypeptidase
MFSRFVFGVIIACPLLAQGVKIQYDPVSSDVVKARLDRNPATNGERAAALHKMFEEAGCSGAMLVDQAVDGAKQPNVICTTEGGGPSMIVIGAHIDFAGPGKGLVENWSGASLLPSLFEALRETPRKHKFVFVGFADRENGRRGSNFYLKSLGLEGKNKIKAMVNVEALGLSQTKVQMDNCDPGLLQKMASIAKPLGFGVKGANNDLVAESDAKTFYDAKIPVISVHSLYGADKKIPGTYADNPSAYHGTEYYYESYKLIAAFLAYLDESLD